jgi:hypothetical protein
MSLLVDVQLVPNRILEAVKARILANRRKQRDQEQVARLRGPTRPRAQRTRFGSTAIDYRRPEPAAQGSSLLHHFFCSVFRINSANPSEATNRLTTVSNTFADTTITEPEGLPTYDPGDANRFETYLVTAVRLKRWRAVIGGETRYFEEWEAQVRIDGYQNATGGFVEKPSFSTDTYINASAGHLSKINIAASLPGNVWGYDNASQSLAAETTLVLPVYPDKFAFSIKPQAQQFPPSELEGAAWDNSAIPWTNASGTITPRRYVAYTATVTRTICLPAGGKKAVYLKISRTSQRSGYWNNTIYYNGQIGETITSISTQVESEHVTCQLIAGSTVRTIAAPEGLLQTARETMQPVTINPALSPSVAISYGTATRPWPGQVAVPVAPTGETLRDNRVLAFWPLDSEQVGDPNFYEFITFYLWTPKVFSLLKGQAGGSDRKPPRFGKFKEQRAAVSNVLYREDFASAFFELHQIWDGGQAGACRNQLIELGFAPADIT